MKSQQTLAAEVLEQAALELHKAILNVNVVDCTTTFEHKALQSALNLINDLSIHKRNQAFLADNDWK